MVDLDALLARPAHHTLRYAAPGARLHHRRAGWVAVEEPENPASGFGHRLILPRSPFVEGVAPWMTRWRAEPRAGQPQRAYFVWDCNTRDVEAEARAAQTAHMLYVLAARCIAADPRATGTAPPAGPPDLVCRPLVGDADWAAAIALGGRAFFPGDVGGHAFHRWASTSRRARIEAGQGVEWGAFVGGRLVGRLGLMYDPEDAGAARFQDVCAHPDFAGRKVVSNLLATALAAFFVDGGCEAWILADVDSRPDRIYAALGFAQKSWFYELGVLAESG